MVTMLQVILFILKAIGILLVSVLGILIVLILAFLIIPIRYSVDARKYEDSSVTLKVGWFLRILYFKMNYEKEKLSYQIKILGIIWKDSDKPKKVKPKRMKPKKIKTNKISYESSETAKKRLIEVREQRKTEEKEMLYKEQTPLMKENIKPKTKKHIKFFDFIKIKNLIITIIKGIKSFPLKIKNIANHLNEKMSLFIIFFQDEKNRQGMKNIWNSIKDLTKHLLPKKLIGNIRFGTGDPCSTGQILAVISVAYPFYGNAISVTPDFLESVIEGDVFVKGRIRLGTLLIITIKLIFNKKFKYLYQSFNKLKEEL